MNRKDKMRWNRIIYGTWAGLFAAFFVGILVLHPEPAARAKEPVSPVPASFSALVEEVSPGVVNIRAVKAVRAGGASAPFGKGDPFYDFFEKFFKDQFPLPKEFKQRAMGSGFILDIEDLLNVRAPE